MDITSPTLPKVKGALFVVLGLLAGGLVIAPEFDWRKVVLLGICVWAFCRAYYFGFYVLQHYVDAKFKYAGIWSALAYLWKKRRGE